MKARALRAASQAAAGGRRRRMTALRDRAGKLGRRHGRTEGGRSIMTRVVAAWASITGRRCNHIERSSTRTAWDNIILCMGYLGGRAF